MKNFKPPRRIYGVDFSGAAQAGRFIWIAGATVGADGLRLEQCRPAAELPGGAPARDDALAALRALILSQSDAALGLDFPFGLPWELVRRHGSWEDFLRGFAARHASPRAFRDHCRERDGGRELRRQTDKEARTPFSPYNLRMFRQTYYGIRDLLAPLVAAGAVCVPPMQPLRAGKPWLLEICPASTLKRMGRYRPYKGKASSHRAMRGEILAHLEHSGLVLSSPSLGRKIAEDKGGDALDAVIAAFTAWRLLRDGAPPAPSTPKAALEAWVYTVGDG
ncbi:MAG: DUF429 domain-containing protein [SAR324 cluster bacterium]|nr:DUF429 domain-containing protein [SAR324 cluster bacterium]